MTGSKKHISFGLGTKFILLVVIILVSSLGIMTAIVVQTQNKVIYEHLEEKGTLLGRFLALVVPDAILSYDFVLLNDVVMEINNRKDIVYGVVFDPEQNALTSYIDVQNPYIKSALTNNDASDLPGIVSQLRNRQDIIHKQIPVLFDGEELGSVAIGLGTESVRALAKEVLYKHVVTYAFFIFILSGSIYLIFRINALRPIQQLIKGATRISRGDFEEEVPLRSRDELGMLTYSFNQMMRILKESLSEKDEALAQLVKLNATLEDRVARRTAELEETQKMLVDTAHKAGMADIATGVLHNLGNVLNSANSSAEEVTRIVKTSKVKSFINANQLLEEHLDHIDEFLSSNEKGRKLPGFYIKLGDVLLEEHSIIGKSMRRIEDKINTMKGIVETQQEYAKAEFHSEKEELPKIIGDVLKIQKDLIESNGVRVTGDYQKPLRCKVHKYKLVQVLINLVKNAVESMTGNDFNNKVKELVIETGRIDDGNDFIKVKDNGRGIPPENLIKIFNHGFTTKEKGHGFGLHSCANSMTEMGGSIIAESDGENNGAAFMVKLPVNDETMDDGGLHEEH